MRRSKVQTQQQKNAELELIIEEFGRAMRNANRQYIARPAQCVHDDSPRFTANMEWAWNDYVYFCQRNPE